MNTPSKYHDTVCWDSDAGHFCTITDTGDDIVLVSAGVFTPDKEAYRSFEQSDTEDVDAFFLSIYVLPDKAVENPADYLDSHMASLASTGGESTLGTHGMAGIRYARSVTEIVEIEDKITA